MEMINAKDRVLHLKDVEFQMMKYLASVMTILQMVVVVIIDVGCSYCAYKVDCWKDSNNGTGLRKFIYANGLRYLTQVAKKPDVPEIELNEF